jgi:hypothetical protein
MLWPDLATHRMAHGGHCSMETIRTYGVTVGSDRTFKLEWGLP